MRGLRLTGEPGDVVTRLEPIWPWLGGIVVAVAALGPALLPGSLLGLDLVMLPRLPLPAGVWGLGPELSRRVPYGVLPSWAAPLEGSAVVGKALMAASLTAAFAGAWRLARGGPPVARMGAGLLYALSPYLLTRVGAGHVGLVLAAGVLPFALPSLLVPGRSPGRTFLWGAALGATGYSGGILAILVVAVGLVAGRTKRSLLGAAAAAAGQLPWLVPGAVILANDPDPVPSVHFATDAPGVFGAAQLLAGHGFWRSSTQVGGTGGADVTLLGAGLAILAVAGAGRLPSAWRNRALGLAVVGFLLALASGAPFLLRGFSALSDTPWGAPLRESQRFLVLTLVWLAPAAALGATRLGGRALQLTPALAAVFLAVPGLWGIGGRLDPLDLPPSWDAARRQVQGQPGTALALPWHRYLDVEVAGGRRVFNPLPDLLGGDVVFSSDPELGPARQEGVDPRERHVQPVLAELRKASPVSGRLADLGIRWVALLHDVDWRRYAAGLDGDPGLERRVRSASLDLFLVRPWRGPVTDQAGRSVPMRAVVAPLRRLQSSDDATWSHPAAIGWMRGWSSATSSANGRVRLPAGGGLVWFWPAVLCLAAQVGVLVAALATWRRLRRAEPP